LQANLKIEAERGGADGYRPPSRCAGVDRVATIGLFLLHRLGHQELALYDASMAERARDPSLPIERG